MQTGRVNLFWNCTWAGGRSTFSGIELRGGQPFLELHSMEGRPVLELLPRGGNLFLELHSGEGGQPFLELHPLDLFWNYTQGGATFSGIARKISFNLKRERERERESELIAQRKKERERDREREGERDELGTRRDS